jgi:hypothetical protein
MTKVSWHTALLGGPVYAIRRGHWQPAEIIGRGRTSCRVKFTDTGNCAQRRYDELVGRCVARHGSDRPVEVQQHA